MKFSSKTFNCTLMQWILLMVQWHSISVMTYKVITFYKIICLSLTIYQWLINVYTQHCFDYWILSLFVTGPLEGAVICCGCPNKTGTHCILSKGTQIWHFFEQWYKDQKNKWMLLYSCSHECPSVIIFLIKTIK